MIMGYSNVIYTSYAMVDIVVPGDPLLELVRIAQKSLQARVTLPTTDAGGDPLTGITELLVVLLEESSPGVNPFGATAPENLESFATSNGGQAATVFLTDSDAGTLKAVQFDDLTVGSVYWVGAVVRDDS